MKNILLMIAIVLSFINISNAYYVKKDPLADRAFITVAESKLEDNKLFMEKAFVNAHNKNPNLKILIKVTKDLPERKVEDIIALAEKAGFERSQITVENKANFPVIKIFLK